MRSKTEVKEIPLDRASELYYVCEEGWLRYKTSWWNRKPGQIVVGTLSAGKESMRYRSCRIDGKQYLVHRVAMAIHIGMQPYPSVDHIDGNRDNNNIFNLRLATQLQQNANVPIERNNSSGRLGVTWDKKKQKWQSRIQVNGEKIRIGYFKEVEEAITARAKAEAKYFGREFLRR
jgi:hypothetical protein